MEQVIFSYNGTTVEVQESDARRYTDTVAHFVEDGGETLSKTFDYNKTLETCFIDGEISTFPNAKAEKYIGMIDTLLANKASREAPPPPTLEEAKANKHGENSEKAEQAREGQAFTVTIDGTTLSFLTDRKTQQDLQTALTFLQAGMQSYTWIDEQGVSFDFTTPSQIIQVSTVFMEKANVYPTWLFYKTQIDEATTVEEVRAIVIDYGINLEA